MNFRDDIVVQDALTIRRHGPEGSSERIVGPGAPPMRVSQDIALQSNVYLSLINPRTGQTVARRHSHNIFINYGRDWIAHLIGLASVDTPFRSDRVKYVGVGIGGAQQTFASADIRDPAKHNHPGFPDVWPTGAGSGDPGQTHTDPAVTGLEWPVLVDVGEYYKIISQDHTFPSTGVIRFTTVFGEAELSYGGVTNVPISEIGLFTQRIDSDLGGQTTPPVVWSGQSYVEKAMVAYNQFPSLPKTTGFVLQVDWELRFR